MNISRIDQLKMEIHKSKTLITNLENYIESDPSHGFCLEFQGDIYNLWSKHRETLLTPWKHYSGRLSYPVVCDVPNGTAPFEYAEMQYYEVSGYKTLNFLDGKYGELRKDLIQHVIGYFKERINMLNIEIACITYLELSSPITGFCTHIGYDRGREFLKYFYSLRYEIYSTWQHYSGHVEFPVPDPQKLDCPRAPATIYGFTTNKLYGQYGELRKDLIHHILKYIEDKLTIN